MSTSSPVPSKTANDKRNRDINAIYLFQGCMSRPGKGFRASTKLACQAIPKHSSYQGSCDKIPTPKLLPVRQLSLSDLMPRLSANTRWRATQMAEARTMSMFWKRSRARQTGERIVSSDSHREKALSLADSNDDSSRGQTTEDGWPRVRG